MSATPRPWKMHGLQIYSPDDHGGNVCELSDPHASQFVEHVRPPFGSKDRDEIVANGELIVRAVNVFDELLAACKLALARELAITSPGDGTENSPYLTDAALVNLYRNAIAKAEVRAL